MADQLDRLHIDAGLDLLRADATLTVHPDRDGNTPATPPTPYVRVYAYIERPADALANSLDGTSALWVTRWICHCVGETEYAATSVAMRVRAALLDVRPTIVGRTCNRIDQDAAAPPTRDETTGSVVFDEVVVYSLMTLPG